MDDEKSPEAEILEPDEEVPEDVIGIDLTHREDLDWLNNGRQESKRFSDYTDEEAEERLEEVEAKLRGVYIDRVAEYLADTIPGYEEERGMPAILGEAAVLVDRVFENDYMDVHGEELADAILFDAVYSSPDQLN